MESEDYQSACIDCGSQEATHCFPCSHTYCITCLYKFNFVILNSFKQMLERNIDALQEKSSFLGCKKKCKRSKLSMSIHFLLRNIDNSGLAPEDKKKFRSIGNLSISFFSGISTKFFICKICRKYRYCVEEKPLICKKCIKKICFKQLKLMPIEIFYNTTISEEEFANLDHLGENYFLAQYDYYKLCYKYKTEVVDGRVLHKIFKIDRIDSDNKVVLARGIESKQDDDFFYIELHEDLQHICLLSFFS